MHIKAGILRTGKGFSQFFKIQFLWSPNSDPPSVCMCLYLRKGGKRSRIFSKYQRVTGEYSLLSLVLCQEFHWCQAGSALHQAWHGFWFAFWHWSPPAGEGFPRQPLLDLSWIYPGSLLDGEMDKGSSRWDVTTGTDLPLSVRPHNT